MLGLGLGPGPGPGLDPDIDDEFNISNVVAVKAQLSCDCCPSILRLNFIYSTCSVITNDSRAVLLHFFHLVCEDVVCMLCGIAKNLFVVSCYFS